MSNTTEFNNLTINMTSNLKCYKGQEQNWSVKVSKINDHIQSWKECTPVNHVPDIKPWFTIVQAGEQVTHYIQMSFTVRIDADGNPLNIQRNAQEAAKHNDDVRNGAKTNEYLEENNLSLCGKSGLTSEVLIAPHKAHVVEIALDEEGNVIQVENGDHVFNFVFASGNAKTDIIGKLDTTDNAETGKSQKGQENNRKLLRELLLKGATEEVVNHYDFIAEDDSHTKDGDGYDVIEAGGFHYYGSPLNNLIEPERFALVVLHGVGTLKKAHKARGNKNYYRRFEFRWLSSWVLPNLTKGGSKQAPKGHKISNGLKFPESSNPNTSAKKTNSSSNKRNNPSSKGESKDMLKDVTWKRQNMTILVDEEDTVEEVMLGSEQASDKGWEYEDEGDDYVLLGKEHKVMLFMKEGSTISSVNKFLAKHKAMKAKSTKEIYLADKRLVYFFHGPVKEELAPVEEEPPIVEEEPPIVEEEPPVVEEEPPVEEYYDDGLEGETICTIGTLGSVGAPKSDPKTQEKPGNSISRRSSRNKNGGDKLNNLSS